ncbi:GTP cyclohydrolase [candidate division TA06 bacterium DG_24]|uniref:GTP cyclohydrolase 1 n=3 Tax=Bacteria division TA06 TaxID=1156500 RepID=A0A0S8JIH0_UNCT6|nr:MAG: GTP cyclohydrolase [candidate division TA06 bacterium DG_24]KPK70769.1 MAG: GTP cyclohydrolase [candidate division TA06 bacterium SM23_40]KPL09511.1 MAG: GTP cyclohydrolase [candidate division TA06 bacterium SM1_40]
MIDKAKVERAVQLFLEGIGEDVNRDGLRGTPARVAEACTEIFKGVGLDPTTAMEFCSAPNQDEMILVRDIPFYSICEHHLLPFFGKAHVAYIPNEDRIAGFSSLVRVIETMAKRPQMQERLTTEIADTLVASLEPKGIVVVIEAEHMCLTMRGVKKPGSLTVTSAMRGIMRKEATRAEAFALIKGRR